VGARDSAEQPLAIRCLKSAFNADVDGQAGLQNSPGTPRCFIT